jgi:glycosyltransferase involved in cell wall biosynthesis
VKIAIVSQPLDAFASPPAILSSIGILTYNFATMLAERGHDVTIYASSRSRSRVSSTNDAGPRIVHIATPERAYRVMMGLLRRAHPIVQPHLPFIGSGLYDPLYAVRVALDARRRGIEIVHVHNFSQYAPIMKSLHKSAKITLHMHCLWLSNFDRSALSRRLSSVDGVICCSNFIRDAARRAFPEFANRMHTVHNGVDTARFDGRLDPGPTQDVYFVGRVSPEKGLHLLIDAFKLVGRALPNARLFIVGSTDPLPRAMYATLGEDPVLERYAGAIYHGHELPPYLHMLQVSAGESLDERVQFLGALSHAELIQRLRSAALVVQPSLCGEAFGMPAAEALAMGLPVVATRAGGLTEIVEHGVSGLLVERGSVEDLATAMIELLGDPARRRSMGAAGRQRAIERFAFTNVARQLEDRYAALLAPPGDLPAAAPATLQPSDRSA